MTKNKKELVEFVCPCPKKLNLHKSFVVVPGTPPEAIITECPDCYRKIKLELENELERLQTVVRGSKFIDE